METGGILFGHTAFLKIIWVDEISGPPPDSLQSCEAFVCGTAGVSEMNDEKEKRTRKSVSFVGMWHTHPLGIPLPSNTDLGAMANLLTGGQFQAKRFLMGIAGGDSSRPLISGTVLSEPITNRSPPRRQPFIGLALRVAELVRWRFTWGACALSTIEGFCPR